MSAAPSPSSNRRDFLTGKAVRRQLEQVGDDVLDNALEQTAGPEIPCGGDTVRLSTRAMACDFAVVMNPDGGAQIPPASEALEMIHAIEQQLTVYRADSELSRLNREALRRPMTASATLFDLLVRSRELALATGGAFDPTSGPLIALWRDCRNRGRVPTDGEVEECLNRIGMQLVRLDETNCNVRFRCDGIELNLGGIGKGDALDRAAAVLSANGIDDFLFHGGHSSLLARGKHADCDGWPVGIRNPLFPQQTFATLL
ncbi:MAG: FAD:protein FMN transferase, partial [Planctomycetes bacterium]|nr:FAD:protein FMN transferase [Planctomycetota bacterium]